MTNNQFINNIRVKNFKSITDANIDLLPLNVVVGRNSAGKSSLMHAILLAAQHLSSDFISDERISLNRNMVNLGTFREVLNFAENLDSSVQIGIDTKDTSWQVDFAQSCNIDGTPRFQSREAMIKKIQIKESPSVSNRSPLRYVNFSFEISGSPVRVTPVLLPFGPGKRAEMPLAVGVGTITYATSESSDAITRTFENCLFLPYADKRIHPLPMEKVDFFHVAVERFYSACERQDRRAKAMRRRSGSRSLVASSGDQNSPIQPLEVSQFFSFLVTNHSVREEPIHVPQFQEITSKKLHEHLNYRDDVERNVTRVMRRIRDIGFRPWEIIDDYVNTSERQAKSRTEFHADLCASVLDLGLSEVKNLLLPVLQSLYGVTSLLVLKPLSLEITEGEAETDVTVLDDNVLIEFFESGRDRVTRSAKNIYYLGPIRDVDYPSAQLPDPRNLGPKGEQAVEVLVHEALTVNDFPLPETFQGLLNGSSTAVNFSEALRAWLVHFEIAKGVITEDQGRDKPRMVVQIGDLSKPINPADNSVDIRSVGQGLSQLLPVIMQCLLAAPGNSLVIIEQPELHLHPKLESQLADFFLACARTGRQIFVETHSEHLINQLRFRIAEDDSSKTQDLVQVLFADQVDGVTRFEKAEIDQYGGLVEEQWPSGFLELNVVAAERLIDAALDKRIHELESVEEAQDSDDDDDF